MEVATTKPEVTEKPLRGFLLVKPGAFITMYKVGKINKFLNHDTKPVKYADSDVPPADQEQLKEVYDADPSYVALVKAPANYDAPWSKAKRKQ